MISRPLNAYDKTGGLDQNACILSPVTSYLISVMLKESGHSVYYKIAYALSEDADKPVPNVLVKFILSVSRM